MVHFRKAGTAGLLPVGHHQGSGPSDAKFVRLSNAAGVMGGGGGSQYGDTGSVGGGDAAQRKNHSQIEKKRRDRMNTYIKVLYSRYLLAFSKFGSEKMCVFKVKLTSKALSVGNDCILQEEGIHTLATTPLRASAARSGSEATLQILCIDPSYIQNLFKGKFWTPPPPLLLSRF